MVQRRKRLLDVDVILDAALVCVDETGRLTMADLAARLGVSASSIYHHFSGRTAIVEALRERMAVAIDPAPLDETDWDEQVGQWMRGYRRALAEHPNLIPLLNEQTMTAGSVLLGYESIAILLRRAGVPMRDVVLWISVLDCYALGAALDLAAPDEVWRPDRDDVPTLGDAIIAAPRGRDRADKAFDLGLDALLTGLRQRLSPVRSEGRHAPDR
ncbi:TetR/AcrR family transcriptional regulator [Kibdelosporangium aridum]|uniref:TetR/AcrR family transcriptional regulator n=1 Tax=Kibdelosporangium aridum TaxID=2030 RepID=A0A428Z118_KIBAR|nr:TetR/AcrR family transcriptional regulator [Kibdelosporangium aridum]RSM78171.1 TetR/AcrR family transcriptional regulator [Kibdelosporangium aridum]